MVGNPEDRLSQNEAEISYYVFSALYVSLPVTLLLVSLVCLAGLVIYGTFHDCDPYLNGKLLARDQVCQLHVICKNAMKDSPYFIHSADFILILALWDQRKYSENLEINYMFKTMILNCILLFQSRLKVNKCLK